MKYRIRVGGIRFLFESERPLKIRKDVLPFLEESEEKEDITVTVSWDWEHFRKPSGAPIGEDKILSYHAEHGKLYCMEREAEKGWLTAVMYDETFRRMDMRINEKPFLQPPLELGLLQRFLPMRQIFVHYRVLYLHSSQILVENRGIVFSAVSGGGKTTQAKLWQRYRQSRILCNDRTLIRKEQGAWHTYGYIVDGSEPVRCAERHALGCIVLLEQAKENRVERIGGAAAAAGLLPQVIVDGWDVRKRQQSVEMVLELLTEIPVYRLFCTPDEAAVCCLEQQLRKDGVL